MAQGRRKSQIGNRNSQILLGAHISIRGGVSMAIERARSIDCTAMQRTLRLSSYAGATMFICEVPLARLHATKTVKETSGWHFKALKPLPIVSFDPPHYFGDFMIRHPPWGGAAGTRGFIAIRV